MLKAEKKRRKFTMKKKAVSALLCATMVAGMLAGCGKGSDSGTPSDTSKGDASNATESASSNLKDDGKVLIFTAGTRSSRAVLPHTIRITRKWMQHTEKSEMWMLYGTSHRVMTMHIRTTWMQHC